MPKDIWISEKWMKNPDIYHSGRRTGLRMRYDKEIDPEVKAAFQELVDWIRARFYFPVRVTVYIKASEQVTASDGDLCVSVSSLPYSYLDEPHSKIATGDYDELVSKRGILQAKIAILLPLFIELFRTIPMATLTTSSCRTKNWPIWVLRGREILNSPLVRCSARFSA